MKNLSFTRSLFSYLRFHTDRCHERRNNIFERQHLEISIEISVESMCHLPEKKTKKLYENRFKNRTLPFSSRIQIKKTTHMETGRKKASCKTPIGWGCSKPDCQEKQHDRYVWNLITIWPKAQTGRSLKCLKCDGFLNVIVWWIFKQP